MCLSSNQNDLFIADYSCVYALSINVDFGETHGQTRTLYTAEKLDFHFITRRGNEILVCPFEIGIDSMFIWLNDTGDFRGKLTSEQLFGTIEEEFCTVNNFIVCPYSGRLWLTLWLTEYCITVLEFE